MRISAVAFLMIVTTVLLSACGKQEMAAVVDHGDSFYGKGGVVSLAAPAPAAATPAKVASNDIAAQYAALANKQPAPAPAAVSSWQWPVNGPVTEKFGQKAEGVVNEGIVIAAAEGTPIKAAQAGEVAFVGKDTKNYGNIVILRHANGDMTSYSHAKSISVTKGEKVASGATIGFVGKSGNAKAPQLHFAVREGKTSIDPLTKLPHSVAMN